MSTCSTIQPNKSLKVLFVSRSPSHFSCYQSIIQHLFAQGVVQVTVLYDPKRSLDSEQAMQTFKTQYPTLVTGEFLQRRDLGSKLLFALRELRSYASYLRRANQSEYYLKRWQGYLPKSLQWLTCFRWMRSLIANSYTDKTIQFIERVIPPSKDIERWLLLNRPDVLVATPMNMLYSGEVEYVKAANRLGIPTMVLVHSWDNLTTKGLYHVIPNWLMAWNEMQVQEAVCIHGVPPEQIIMTGAPVFDKWFETNWVVEERTRFCHKLGIDPNKPYLVYLGSTKNIAPDESWLIQQLVKTMRTHPNPVWREMGWVIRPHPANDALYQNLQIEDPQVVIWPQVPTLPDNESSQQDFINTVKHAVATVGINTTGMIDALLMDKPCIAILVEQYRKTQVEALHFQSLQQFDVLTVSESVEVFLNHLEKLMAGSEDKTIQRENFIRHFVRPQGLNIPAGQIAANRVIQVAQGLDPLKSEHPDDLARQSAWI